MEGDFARLDSQQAGDGLEQGCLARAIGAHEGYAMAALDIQVEVVDGRDAVVCDRGVLDLEAVRRCHEIFLTPD